MEPNDDCGWADDGATEEIAEAHVGDEVGVGIVRWIINNLNDRTGRVEGIGVDHGGVAAEEAESRKEVRAEKEEETSRNRRCIGEEEPESGWGNDLVKRRRRAGQAEIGPNHRHVRGPGVGE